MVSNWKGWEAWRFTKRDDGTYVISSWTHRNRVLRAHPDGRVDSSENHDGTWERWKIVRHPNAHGVLVMSTAHKSFLSFHGENLYLSPNFSDLGGIVTTWHLEPVHRNCFYISSTFHEKQLAAGPDSRIYSQPNRQARGTWCIEPAHDGRVGIFAIRSKEHGHFLGSTEEGELGGVVHSEDWAIIKSPHGGIYLQSIKHEGKRVACDGDHVYLTDRCGACTSWNLEAILPTSLSEEQIWRRVGIGAATVLAAVAAPFTVLGVVSAMGFGSGGIVAGSMAAWMMSAETIASGGAIAAGGTVATLQSIGAVGLSASATALAASSGAVVTTVIASATNGRQAHANANAEALTDELPLCSWRQWPA